MISEKLKELRLSKGYSQQRIALELNISQTAYYKWEKRKTKPSFKNLLKISKYFNVSISELILISEDKPIILNIKSQQLVNLKTFINRQDRINFMVEKQKNLVQRVLNT